MDDIIISIIGSSAVSTLISLLANRRRSRIDAQGAQDAVFAGRVKFLRDSLDALENRLKSLEEKLCYRENCKERI
jgi:ubiquinone biosynthesis protein UbiJ